jgi:hypothetical protein
MMDKVQNPSNSECYEPPSGPFRNYMLLSFKQEFNIMVLKAKWKIANPGHRVQTIGELKINSL